MAGYGIIFTQFKQKKAMTKKTLLIATMLSFALCGYAQKGERGIGVSCAVKYPTIEKDYSGIGVELKYMKYLTDKLRMLPYANIDYSESSDDLYAYFGVDFHRFCYDSNVWNPYFIAGLHIGGDFGPGGGNWKIGGGINLCRNENLSYQLEICLNTYDMFVAPLPYIHMSLGFVYTFPEREKHNTNEYTPIYIPYNIGTNVGTGVGAGAGSVSTGTSTTIQIEERCRLCAGTGICTTCNGRRQMINSYTGQYQDCPNCHAPLEGKCHSCGGTGRK